MIITEQKLSVTEKYHAFFNDKKLYSFILKNDVVEIAITNFGGIILSIKTPDKFAGMKNIVAGFKTIEEYENNKYFFGCIVGRYANRIANGRFKINDTTCQATVNDGIDHLHGGNNGFHKQVWDVTKVINNKTQAGIEFKYVSKDGEEGFPGNVIVTVQYLLNNKNELIIHYHATTDKATPVSLTNHSYFNLSGFQTATIEDHLLWVNANQCTEKNTNNLPTGKFTGVNNTVFDFLAPKKIGANIHDDVLEKDSGYDHNFVLKHNSSNKILHAAQLTDPASGRLLNVFTNAPGIQLYTSNNWDGSIIGAQNKKYIQHGAVALETQSFPDSPNHPNFPNTILFPGEEYQSTTIYAFGINNL